MSVEILSHFPITLCIQGISSLPYIMASVIIADSDISGRKYRRESVGVTAIFEWEMSEDNQVVASSRLLSRSVCLLSESGPRRIHDESVARQSFPRTSLVGGISSADFDGRRRRVKKRGRERRRRHEERERRSYGYKKGGRIPAVRRPRAR